MATVFALSFMTALTGALMPGPLLTVTIAETARRGFLASAALIAGHALLELLLIVGLWFGLGHFLKVRPVIGTISVLGGLMLLWMGWGMIRDARRGVLDLHATIERSGKDSPDSPGPQMARIRPSSRLIGTGMAVSISNPYWVIWWATVGLAFFAALSHNAVTTIGVFYLGHISGDILWYLAVGLAIATGRKLISAPVYRRIIQFCGVFLIFLGATFLYLVASGGLWQINMTIGSFS